MERSVPGFQGTQSGTAAEASLESEIAVYQWAMMHTTVIGIEKQVWARPVYIEVDSEVELRPERHDNSEPRVEARFGTKWEVRGCMKLEVRLDN